MDNYVAIVVAECWASWPDTRQHSPALCKHINFAMETNLRQKNQTVFLHIKG